MNEAEEIAKRRFMTLNLVRLLGVMFVFVGIANIGGRLLPELSPWLGAILLVNGALDFFVIPPLLKKRWRTPDA